jgi:hypothetical protein
MRAKGDLRPGTARLVGVLLVSCLTVALLAAGAQAQTGRRAALGPNTIQAVQLSGDCFFSVRWDWVHAHMSAWTSGGTGTGYLNIYRRFATGNMLVSHRTGRIDPNSHRMSISTYIDLASGGRYFATWGINSSSGNSSGGVSCRRAS